MVSYHVNAKDACIIMYLADNQNIGGGIIADETSLNKSYVSKHLNKLKEVGIVDYNTCSPQEGKNYTGKCWYVNPDPETFAKLLKTFIGNKHLEDFLHSPYVEGMEAAPMFRIILDTISDHMEPVQLLVETLGLPSPAEQWSQKMSQIRSSMEESMIRFEEVASTLPPHSTAGDVLAKLEEEEERHNQN